MMDVLGSDEDALEAALGLGELAGLTVTNEADAYDVSNADTFYLVDSMMSVGHYGHYCDLFLGLVVFMFACVAA